MPQYHLSQAVSADQALSSLRVLIIAGQNVIGTSAGSDPGELVNRYLQLGEEALRQLRWLFGSKADPLVATWFYRDVAADRVRRRLAAGVESELQARLAELEALVEEIADATAAGNDGEMPPSPDQARTVFVVFGRNLAARNAMVSFLRSVDLKPLEWDEAVHLTGSGSPYVGQVLDSAFAAAQAVVVLLTPDEISYLRAEYANGPDDPESQPSARPRPNVLFEAGLAFGRHPNRTILHPAVACPWASVSRPLHDQLWRSTRVTTRSAAEWAGSRSGTSDRKISSTSTSTCPPKYDSCT